VNARPVLEKVKALSVEAIHQPERVIREVESAILAEARGEQAQAAQEQASLAELTDGLAALNEREDALYARLDAGLVTEAP
jgi:hypothetical protein